MRLFDILARFPRRLSQEPRPVRWLIANLLWVTRLSRVFLPWGVNRIAYKIHCHPTPVALGVWLDPTAVNEEERFVGARLRPGATFVDVGANVGLVTLRAASHVGRTGRVIAFEAHPRTARFLKENLSLNGFDFVEVHSFAVGESAGEVVITNQLTDDQNHVRQLTDSSGAGIAVRVASLDSMLESVEQIDVLKIDVEGFELSVLRGATQTLTRTSTVLLEVSASHAARYGYHPRDVLALLEDGGFHLYRLRNDQLIPIGKAQEFTPVGYYENVVARRE